RASVASTAERSQGTRDALRRGLIRRLYLALHAIFEEQVPQFDGADEARLRSVRIAPKGFWPEGNLSRIPRKVRTATVWDHRQRRSSFLEDGRSAQRLACSRRRGTRADVRGVSSWRNRISPWTAEASRH